MLNTDPHGFLYRIVAVVAGLAIIGFGEAVDFLHEVRIAIVDGGSAKFLNYLRRLRGTRSVDFHVVESPQLQERSADTA